MSKHIDLLKDSITSPMKQRLIDPDLQLAQSVRAGDPVGSERFVRSHYDAVYRSMLLLTGNPDDARDLTQDAFVLARRKIGSFRGGARLRTWIQAIAFNRYTKWRRRHRIQPEVTEDMRVGAVISEDVIVLRQAIMALPEDLRMAFVLDEIEGYSLAELSSILKVPPDTARSRVYAAKLQLRSKLATTFQKQEKSDEQRCNSR